MSWVERIFARLVIRYGIAFMRQWPDTDEQAVKADWCSALGNMPPEAIKYALDNLPEKPMNAQQFRAICNRAPREEYLQLPAPSAEPEKVAGIIGAAKAAHMAGSLGSPAKQALQNIINILAAKTEGPSTAQKDFVKTCANMLPPGDPLIQQLRTIGFNL